MKRLILVCLCLMLLCACARAAEPTIPAATKPPAVTQAPPTEPAGLYEPGSWQEIATGGALKLYPLNSLDTLSVVPLGGDLLLLQTYNTSTLTKLSGTNLTVTATAQLKTAISLDDPSVQVGDWGVTYYDPNRAELVFLDTQLQEVRHIQAPVGMLDTPALAADRKSLYYFTDSGLRVLDLESGIDRLLRQMHFYYQTVVKLHFNDSVLQCSISDEHGDWRQVYLSTDTGELLYESSEYISLITGGNRYFTTHLDGTYSEKLIGTLDGPVRTLHCPDPDANAFPLLERNAVVTSSQVDGALVLDYYSLADGTRPYSLTMPADCYPWCFTWDSSQNCLWFLWYDESRDSDVLTRWDLDKSTVEDDTVYVGMRRTADNPNLEGLEDCAAYAARISAQYGIEILTWTGATAFQPWDYLLEPEYQVSVVTDALDTLDAALSHFPEGFFRETAAEMGDGILRIGLVRGIYGIENADTLETAGGLQYWDNDGNAHISLQICYEMEQNLYHELYHAIESHIFSHSQALDNWDGLNPPGFSYDYEYTSYTYRIDYELLEGDSRAFIDFYSMTYPKEDRARILEYAMMTGTENYFSSDTMQQKLLALCTGIREAYGLTGVTEAFLWEQYLKTPLHAYG